MPESLALVELPGFTSILLDQVWLQLLQHASLTARLAEIQYLFPFWIILFEASFRSTCREYIRSTTTPDVLPASLNISPLISNGKDALLKFVISAGLSAASTMHLAAENSRPAELQVRLDQEKSNGG
jgi:hypothetical protein